MSTAKALFLLNAAVFWDIDSSNLLDSWVFRVLAFFQQHA